MSEIADKLYLTEAMSQC